MARTGHMIRRRTTEALAKQTDLRAIRPGNEGVWARLRYAFDKSMARGTPALILWLFALTSILVLAFALANMMLDLRDEKVGFWSETFRSLMHALDPGTVAGETGSGRYLLTMLVLTIAGLLLVSALIGVISAGIDNRIAELRRGRSLVLEKNHTVILGWSSSIFTVINELTIANESRRRPAIVILADRDKVEMEDDLRLKVPELRGTRIVCRSGSPSSVADLAIARPSEARAIVVLSGDGTLDSDGVDADSEVIKTLLALRAVDADGTGPRVVAQMRDPANLEVARLIARDQPGRLALLDVRETIARLIVQTSRQSGAAAVYRELFAFAGDEIYIHADHSLAGATYGEAQLHYESVTVIGLTGADGVVLNPPADAVVAGALIVIAEDDCSLEKAAVSSAVLRADAFGCQGPESLKPDHTVLLGWNERAPVVVRELDALAAPGSTLTVVATTSELDLPATNRLAVTVVRADTTRRSVLDEHLGADSDRVIVLCYSDDLDAEMADAKTLITLLHVRDILSQAGSSAPVVSEMIDDRDRELAEVADIDDIVVSGEIVNLVLTQVAEDERIEPVLQELLRAEGSEVCLCPAEWYVEPGREVNWATVVASALRRGETAIGFSLSSLAEGGAAFGIVVNPTKSQLVMPAPGDRIVVLSEN